MTITQAELVYEYCKDDEECPNSLAPDHLTFNGPKCGLFAAQIKHEVYSIDLEWNQCVQKEYCNERENVDTIDPDTGLVVNLDVGVYCGGGKFWYKNKAWIIIIIIILALICLAFLYACLNKKKKSSAF